MSIEAMKQEPMALTYKEVTDTMNALRRGTLEQQQAAAVMENKKLYTTPPPAQPVKVWDAEGYDSLVQQLEMLWTEKERLTALLWAQQTTIEKLEAQHESK